MVIGIDGNEANTAFKVGIGQYAFQVLWHIYRIQSSSASWRIKDQKYKLKYKIYLKNNPVSDLPPETSWWKYQVFGPKKLWTQFALPIKLWQEKIIKQAPDVFFSLTHYAPRFCPVPSIICVMDLAFIKFPEFFLKKDLIQLKQWTSYSVRQAKKIITISENSKKDIIKYYGVTEDKIEVIYPGYDRNKFNPNMRYQMSKINEVKQRQKIDGDYFLYVGTIQPRKNLVRVLEAFADIKKKKEKNKITNKNLKLVMCGMVDEGRGGWMQQEFFDKIKTLNLEGEVIITGYVDEHDISYLIAGAKVFILPSLYEGFGMPVLEAMAIGIPSVVSKVSSLLEVCGKSVIYIEDPYCVQSISLALIKALELSGKERENLIKSGYIQTQNFSWENTGKKVLKVLLNTQN